MIVIWRGLMGRKPYPAALSPAPQIGRRLAANRDDD
jgi:hypothetical protein